MKKIISVVLICTCLFSVVTVLAGCEKENAPKEAVCFVIANTANSQGLNMNSPLVQDTVFNTILNYGYISVVSVDGQPEVVMANSFDIEDQFKNASPDKLRMDARSKATSVIAGMECIVANDEEADYLEGLHLAVRTLASLEGYDSKTIIVIGTGISTCNIFDFRNNLLSADADAVVEQLVERSAIPDFNSMTVVFQQLGDTAHPQQELTPSQRIKLQQIYQGIVEEGNGVFIYNNIIPGPVNDNVEYPSVSVVELPADSPIQFESESLSNESFSTPMTLSEEQVRFVPDSAEYTSPEEVLETLRPIAEYMITDNPDIELLLVGCIAGDSSSDAGYTLSYNRASSVKRTLTQLGVPQNRLIVKGLGSSDPWHIEGAGYEGTLAAQNRRVVLIDASTSLAEDIINS